MLTINDAPTIYQRGKTLKECAYVIGVSAFAVRSHLEKLGVKRRPPGKRKLTDKQWARIVKGYMNGQTMMLLAKEYGITRQAISLHFQNRDIQSSPISARRTPIILPTRICTRCEKMLSESAFYGGRKVCKECRKQIIRLSYSRGSNILAAHRATTKLERPSQCSKCGSHGNIHGHHNSYAPEHHSDVEWLCSSCHKKLHSKTMKENVNY